MSQKLDLSIDQGSDFYLLFVWAYGGVPYDLTGYTAHLQFRRTPDAAVADLDLSTANGGITITPLAAATKCSDGKTYGPTAYPTLVRAKITNQQADLLSSVYDWSVKLFSPGGEESTIYRGKANICPSVTRE